MGGRIVALAINESDPSMWWVATASGGLLKTTNNGNTFEHQFDREATVSVGDVAVSASEPNVVWVGTGENNARNSVSYGDGVYKSVDGGKTWKNMGLKKSFQVGKIAIHPKNPDVVYVGALGRLYGPNEERGLYRTGDGGKSWKKVLAIDDRTGIIDVQMHPSDPETLLVASYERQRDGYDVNEPAKKVGPGSALHRTTDGGKTWTKLTKGLPTCNLGRIGISYYRKNPEVVFAIVESEKIATGPAVVAVGGGYLGITGGGEDQGTELRTVTRGGPADKAGLRTGDVLVSIDGKVIKKFSELTDLLRNRKPGDTIKVKRQRDGKVAEVAVQLGTRPGGAARTNPFAGSLGGSVKTFRTNRARTAFRRAESFARRTGVRPGLGSTA
jgi:photosystem II stability/assembly factor-like uncharacterized protein